MRKQLHCFLLFCIFTFLSFSNLQAQDFVYKPKNPAFGGDTFNYNWLLSSAQAQNLIKEPEVKDNGRSSLDAFTKNLERQLLSNLSRQLTGAQFGENNLEDGLYQIGTFSLDVISTLDGLSITISDSSSGENTQIIIPYF
ncbi:MAG TPA: curli production assembly/transport component CsgF [Saprospiraceae bacterium]|nr:curli production assembly/transport component CsgF [Saprospiraceae bacterium]